MPKYLLEGRRLAVGARIGRGGEGEVFRLGDGTARALKVYHRPDTARAAKVDAMIKASLVCACPSVAFPEAIVTGRDGSFAGFVMPLVEGTRAVHDLYGGAARRRFFPQADFRFMVRAATNLARSVARVHAAGAVVGDMNQSGVLVSPTALVTLIDADSFQFAGHPCRVGVPEFTAPELQGLDLGHAVRTSQHDAFALAVMIFELLALGRHPMAGVPAGRDVPLQEAIRTHRFAYSAVRDVRLGRPPGTLRLSDLPAGVRAGFEIAFGTGFGPRLEASGWVAELEELEGRLRTCARDGAHHYLDAAHSCPWCRIERQVGGRVFGSGPAVARPEPRDVTILAMRSHQALILAGKLLDGTIRPPTTAGAVTESGMARAYLQRQGEAKVLAVRKRLLLAKGRRSTNLFMARHANAEDRVLIELDRWRTVIGLPRLSALANRVRGAMAAVDQLPRTAEDAEVMAAAERDVRMTMEALRSVDLSTSAIPGVGGVRKQLLRAAGVVTAAQLKPVTLAAVKGLGAAATAALLVWRDRVAAERRRALHCSVAALPDARSAIAARVAEIEAAAAGAVRDLERAVATTRDLARLPDGPFSDALAARDQAVADLHYLCFPVPGVGAASAAQPTAAFLLHLATSPSVRAGKGSARPKLKAKSNAKGCPKCGGPVVKRWARSGPSANGYFLGCQAYPSCTGSRSIGKRVGP